MESLSAPELHTQNHPPFRHLPKEITKLTQLRRLILKELDLRALPDDFGRLQNLDTLDLFMNKLIISHELEKLATFNPESSIENLFWS